MGFSWAILMVAVVVATAGVAEGQSDCAVRLTPCLDYLNSTTPSQQCCNALQGVMSTQLQCLCNLYTSPAMAAVNITQALELPTHCRLSNDISACKAFAAGPGSGSSANPPPPGTPGRDESGASMMSSWMGMSTLVLVSAFTFLY